MEYTFVCREATRTHKRWTRRSNCFCYLSWTIWRI